MAGSWRAALPLILILYLGLAIVHAFSVPIGLTYYQDAPDEAAHMTYARMVASGALPTQHHPASDTVSPHAPGYEWHQPPLYYMFASLFVRFGDRCVRFASILIGLGCILLIYQLARELFPDDPQLAVLAAGIAALTPSHIAITSVVNNDGLLELCVSAALLILVRAMQRGFTVGRAGWLGAAVGAAILTKATGLLLIPVVVLALILLRKGGEPANTVLKGASWAALFIGAVDGWWFVRNWILYGQPLPLRAFEAAFAGTRQASEVAAQVGGWDRYLLEMGKGIFCSFWAVFGRPEREPPQGVPHFLPDQVYVLMALICMTAFGGLIRLHFQRKTALTEIQTFSLWILFATLLTIALAFLQFILKYFQMQGRYLYPAMMPICVVLALGWRAAFPERYKNLAGGLLLALLGSLAVAYIRYILPD